MKGYTKEMAYQLGYQLGYTAERLTQAAAERGQAIELAVLRTGEAMRIAAEAVITGEDPAAHELADSFTIGCVVGRRAAS
jgi:hypothetical protein